MNVTICRDKNFVDHLLLCTSNSKKRFVSIKREMRNHNSDEITCLDWSIPNVVIWDINQSMILHYFRRKWRRSLIERKMERSGLSPLYRTRSVNSCSIYEVSIGYLISGVISTPQRAFDNQVPMIVPMALNSCNLGDQSLSFYKHHIQSNPILARSLRKV